MFSYERGLPVDVMQHSDAALSLAEAANADAALSLTGRGLRRAEEDGH